MTDRPVLELIQHGSQQIERAVIPTGIEERAGKAEFVPALPQSEVLGRARENQALSPVDVKSFLDNTSTELAVLEKIPPTLRLNLESGAAGAQKRREQLREVLGKIGIKEEQIGAEKFSPDEIWDAVLYATRLANDNGAGKDNGLNLLNDARGARIKRSAAGIATQIGEEKVGVINALGRAVEAEEFDSLSVNSNRLNIPKIDMAFHLHPKQKPSATEVDVRAVLVVRKKLQRIDVVQAFLNQRAEGRAGQVSELKPGEPQLSDQVSWNENLKQIQVQGVPFSGDPNHLTVVEMLDVLEDGERMFNELRGELLEGNQGRSGWIAEAILRRLNEVWTETSDIKQKAVGEIKTWISQLGRGHLVAEFLEIPDVGRILSWPDWYQQRDPLTDRPINKEKDTLPLIEARVKARAKDLGIPTSKVDLALYLSRILQLGYWTGRVGYKHRVFAKRYGLEELGAGVPVGFFDGEEAVLEQLPRDERINLEAQIADLNATVVGTLTDYTAEHLHRVVDNAVQEDALYRMGVGDAPVYGTPSEEVIEALSITQKIPIEDEVLPMGEKRMGLRSLFKDALLHREQYRWLFVWARLGGLYDGWERRIGEAATERQYLNPKKEEDRGALIEWLQRPNSPAVVTLREAGVNPAWITDTVAKELFTDENMERVNLLRQNRGGKVDLNSLRPDMARAERRPAGDQTRINVIASALELVLRDKRTWGVDMGINNDLLAKPELTQEIRKKGGFGSDEFGVMVTLEFNRLDIHKTFVTFLEKISRARLKDEFPDNKDVFNTLSTMYAEEPRWRGDSLVGPYMAMNTALSVRAKDMMAGYLLAGFEGTQSPFANSQQHASDVLDQWRVLYWYKPVIGAARRIFGRENYVNWITELKRKQRADIYSALDTRWEQLFRSTPDLQQILAHLIKGDNGKGMYSQCVRTIRPDGLPGEIILYEEPDVQNVNGQIVKSYWLTRNERESRYLYFPASMMAVTSMESQARQGQLDRDKARTQMDQLVAAGFMRRWYNDEFEPVGLGDLFNVEFTTYYDQEHKGLTVPQRQKFPIDFMIDLRQQARGISIEFAAAHGINNPTQFWELGKTGRLAGNDLNLWHQFREMMLEGWLVNVDQDESRMPQFYWQWREQALEALNLTEERLEEIPEGGIPLAFFRLKTRAGELSARALGFLRAGGGWAEQYIATHRNNFIQRLREDPVREELGRVENEYGKWVVEEITEQLDRANERGLFLGEKVQIRKSIEDHYRQGKIDQATRDLLFNKVIETSYRPNLWRDLADPNFWVNNSWVTVPGIAFTLVGGLLENFKVEVTKQLWFDQAKAILNASPAGYVAATLFSIPSIITVVRAAISIGEMTNIPTPILGGLGIPVLTIPISLLTAGRIFLSLQSGAIVASNALRLINSASRWVTKRVTGKARGLADSDELVTIKERISQ